jgi:Kef-type K+ transport system membrane component KefB
VSLTSAAVVAVIALLAPLAVWLTGLRLPEIVLQIVLGILVGPQLLGWAHLDEPVHVLSVLGLALLLLLAGLEIDFDRLRGLVLRRTSAGFVLSFVLAVAVGLILARTGLVPSPLLIA